MADGVDQNNEDFQKGVEQPAEKMCSVISSSHTLFHLLAMSFPVICPMMIVSETMHYICQGYNTSCQICHIIESNYHMESVSIYLGILKMH